MTATVEPSGEKTGFAIWRGGFHRRRVAPEAASTARSSARHQLSSPEPFAATAANVRPSADQAYS